MKQIIASNQLIDITLKKKNTPQNKGVIYNEPQKIEVSIFVSLISLADSNIHSSVPSSFTSFHHLKPTNNLPEIFLTNQKSNAEHITIRINDNASPNNEVRNKNLYFNLYLHYYTTDFKYQSEKNNNWIMGMC